MAVGCGEGDFGFAPEAEVVMVRAEAAVVVDDCEATAAAAAVKCAEVVLVTVGVRAVVVEALV